MMETFMYLTVSVYSHRKALRYPEPNNNNSKIVLVNKIIGDKIAKGNPDNYGAHALLKN